MKFQTLLFDYGGTLDTCGMHWAKVLYQAWLTVVPTLAHADFYEAYVYAERQLSKEHAVDERATFLQVLHQKLNLQSTYLRERQSMSFNHALSSELIDTLAHSLDRQVRATMTQAQTLLRDLQPRYQLGLVSNFYGNLSAVLQTYAVQDFFDVVIESAKVGVRKPDARLWQIALEHFHAQPDTTLVIGDSLKNDILPAHSLGCATLWLTQPDSLNTPPVEADKADYIAHTFEDVRQLLLR